MSALHRQRLYIALQAPNLGEIFGTPDDEAAALCDGTHHLPCDSGFQLETGSDAFGTDQTGNSPILGVAKEVAANSATGAASLKV